MTDKEKLAKVRAEIEKQRQFIRPKNTGEMKVVDIPKPLEQGWLNALKWMEGLIDSMQKELESHKPKITLGEATGKLKELVDNISEEGIVEAHKQLEELTKECMYSKDNYTDEDRKVLCEGCEEECKYVPPVFDEGYWERLGEEPVSDDMEAEFLRAAHNLREQPTLSAWFKHFYNLGKQHNKKWLANNHKQIFNNGYEEGFEAGRDDMEEQMMAKAVDGFVIEDIEEGNGDFLLSAEYLSKDIGLKDRQKVKVIVIKGD